MIRIRLAAPDEADVVHAVMMEAFAEYRAYPNPSSALDETREDVRRELARGGGVLALDGSRVVGSLRFVVERGPGRFSFARMGVVPDARGRGIGGQMLDFVESHARELGFSAIKTAARSQQPDNRPYYESRGYVVTGSFDRYGVAGLRTEMQKTL